MVTGQRLSWQILSGGFSASSAPSPAARYTKTACTKPIARPLMRCVLVLMIMDALQCARAQEVTAINGQNVVVPTLSSFSTTATGLAGTVFYAEGKDSSTGAPSMISATSTNLFTMGDGAYGAYAANGARIDLIGNRLTGPG